MPLYQYRCTKCGHEFELLTTIDKRNEARCPKCGEKAERGWMGKAAFGPMNIQKKPISAKIARINAQCTDKGSSRRSQVRVLLRP